MFERDLAGSLAEVAVRRGSRGFTFDDLRSAAIADAPASSIGGVADWLADVRRSGLIEDLGFDDGEAAQTLGPRRYRMRRTR